MIHAELEPWTSAPSFVHKSINNPLHPTQTETTHFKFSRNSLSSKSVDLLVAAVSSPSSISPSSSGFDVFASGSSLLV